MKTGIKNSLTVLGFFAIMAGSSATAMAGYFNTDPIATCQTQINQTLQTGSEGKDVYVLQQMLSNAGFLNASPNGYFGRQTVNAVKSFQRNNGLSVTGSVGPMTLNAVNERLCDTDLVDNTYSSYDYGYSSGITYVAKNDPFVKVITPSNTNPSIYATPQNNVNISSVRSSAVTISSNPVHTSSYDVTSPSTQIVQSNVSSQIAGTNIVYNPATGYSYGLIQKTGSITVSSPRANTTYQEGDTVTVNWTSNNIQTNAYSILLESNNSSQSRLVGTVSGNSYSFVLSKELLDAVCFGSCNNDQQSSFKVVVTTPTTDIAGITSTLRAAVAPIAIKRPFGISQMSFTAKNPVASGEVFKLYINVPTGIMSSVDSTNGTYTLKLRSVCPSSLTVSLAGAACGQEIVVPFDANRLSQGIPVSITNPTWFKQEVTFQGTLVGNNGQTAAIAEIKVSANAAPFSW